MGDKKWASRMRKGELLEYYAMSNVLGTNNWWNIGSN